MAHYEIIGPLEAADSMPMVRRDQGLDASWKHASDVVRLPLFFPTIVMVGPLLALIFGVWVATAHAI